MCFIANYQPELHLCNDYNKTVELKSQILSRISSTTWILSKHLLLKWTYKATGVMEHLACSPPLGFIRQRAECIMQYYQSLRTAPLVSLFTQTNVIVKYVVELGDVALQLILLFGCCMNFGYFGREKKEKSVDSRLQGMPEKSSKLDQLPLIWNFQVLNYIKKGYFLRQVYMSMDNGGSALEVLAKQLQVLLVLRQTMPCAGPDLLPLCPTLHLYLYPDQGTYYSGVTYTLHNSTQSLLF